MATLDDVYAVLGVKVVELAQCNAERINLQREVEALKAERDNLAALVVSQSGIITDQSEMLTELKKQADTGA